MILNGNQIEEIKHLILDGKDKQAISKLVEYSGCAEYDARCLVEDYNANENFELLLDKHWIEKRESTGEMNLETPKLSRKEVFSLMRIFLPAILIMLIAGFVIIFN